MLIEKITDLRKEKVRLDKEIFVFDSRNKEITDQIEQLETKIKNLQN